MYDIVSNDAYAKQKSALLRIWPPSKRSMMPHAVPFSSYDPNILSYPSRIDRL
jgi:hypothetical protein